ncbi:MAG: hypothetical protein PF689_06035 [Deltaproteobacteria bacterium]|jgi:hypothetical protein|nr:hypothetical protein [Deltaproteobacteria bacterium]
MLKKLFVLIPLFSFLSIPVFAQTPASPKNTESTQKSKYRAITKVYKSFQIQLGMDFSGPIMFKDVPDNNIDELTVFKYGGYLNFVLGNEQLDLHRFGLGVSYFKVAESDERDLSFINPYFIYEIGFPFILQLKAGYTITQGTKDFKDNYSGIYGGINLKYSFVEAGNSVPVSVSAGLGLDAIIAAESFEYSSVFAGLKIEIIYHH